MKKKFNVNQAFSNFYDDVNAISSKLKLDPAEQLRQSRILEAIKTIQEANVLDIAKCALGFNRQLSGKPAKIKESVYAIITLKHLPKSKHSFHYLKILFIYARALQNFKQNLSNFTLHFILVSQISPLSSYFTIYLQNLIDEAKAKILNYQN